MIQTFIYSFLAWSLPWHVLIYNEHYLACEVAGFSAREYKGLQAAMGRKHESGLFPIPLSVTQLKLRLRPTARQLRRLNITFWITKINISILNDNVLKYFVSVYCLFTKADGYLLYFWQVAKKLVCEIQDNRDI